MNAKSPQNILASIRAKLLNVSRPTGEDFHVTLARYAVERFLYRLSQSPHCSRFILKGAMLMVAWTTKPHRPTQDLDLLGIGDLSDDPLLQMLHEIIQAEVIEDGLEFDPDSITLAEIREGQAYRGKRIKLTCRLGKTRIRVQIDIGIGDVVVPRAKTLVYPTLLDLPAPRVRAYSREAVVAEKLEAMISLAMINSRMKDFYDLWFMSQQFSFAGHTLSKAIAATFKRRKTTFPEQTLAQFLKAFMQDEGKQKQWRTFIQRADLETSTSGFRQVLERLDTFLTPVLEAAAEAEILPLSWEPGGPWIRASR